MKILIDNGHGKETSGKRSPVWPDGTQLFEWDWVRDIARRVYGGLKLLGYDVVLLVPEDKDIALSERCKRANAYGKDCLFVSIHGNAGGGTGWEVWAYSEGGKDDESAKVFEKFVSANLPQFKNRGVKYRGLEQDKPFYVLKNTVMPAVLTENLFYDHATDCKFMLSEAGRKAIANLHIQAIQAICDSW